MAVRQLSGDLALFGLMACLTSWSILALHRNIVVFVLGWSPGPQWTFAAQSRRIVVPQERPHFPAKCAGRGC